MGSDWATLTTGQILVAAHLVAAALFLFLAPPLEFAARSLKSAPGQ
jgi:hypothetical protein